MAAIGQWFDNLARGVAAPNSRRFILGGLLGGFFIPGAPQVQAAQNSPGQCKQQGGRACCVSVQNDPENCGACGSACAPGQLCVSGRCACPAGMAICNGACADTQRDPLNCGSCGHSCGTGSVCAR